MIPTLLGNMMPLIEKVLGCCDYSEGIAQFPYLATPKVDGVRGYTKNGLVYAKSNKLIPNRLIQERVPTILTDGFDFELKAGDFNETTSTVMAHDAPLDKLNIYIFDYVDPDKPIKTYFARMQQLHSMSLHLGKQPGIHLLLPFVIRSPEQLHIYFKHQLELGHEGIILRKPEGTYKFGKSTQIEQLMMRITANATGEAVIIGFEELMLNDNPSFVAENGRAKKSKCMSGLRGSGRLGSFLVRDLHSDITFNVTASNGLTDEDRISLWQRKGQLVNKIIKYSYKSHGTVEKPRQPKFEGFRDPIDMTEEAI